jgi:hypothetical protein
MKTHPLLTLRELSAPFARRMGQTVHAAQFLSEAMALAEALPADGLAVNLCKNRYNFTLGLCAALIRGQATVLPPNASAQTLASFSGGDRMLYVLAEGEDIDSGGLPRIEVGQPAQASAVHQVPEIPAGADAAYLLTSGSSGTPRPHIKRWGQLVENIEAAACRIARLAGLPSLAGVTFVATVPPQHSFGLESSVLIALLGGAILDGGRPFYPADVAQALADVPRPRALVSAPFHLKTLLASGVAVPPVDIVVSATSAISMEMARRIEKAFGGPLVEIYGCTEAGQIAMRRSTVDEAWETMGELRLRDDRGTTLVEGGHVTEPTPLADQLHLLDDRRFHLSGRTNDLIHVAGKRSSLSHLNFELNHIEGVEDGAFWMPPGGADGDVVRPVVFVVAPALGAQEIVQALRSRVEQTFVPRKVFHVLSLPREETGKLKADVLHGFALWTLASAEGRTYEIVEEHPAFAGHFPGRPIFPGVSLLELVMRTLEDLPFAGLHRPAVLDAVKFLAPVRPGESVTVLLQRQDGGVDFDVTRDGDSVARGRISFGDGGPPWPTTSGGESK